MMQLQRNEKEKKHHREALVIIKYVEDRFSERSEKKEGKATPRKKFQLGKVCNEARHNPKIFITI